MSVKLESQWIKVKEIKKLDNGMLPYYWFGEDYIVKRVII